MRTVLVNYNFDPAWLKDYPEMEVTMYDRSDDGVERDLTQYGRIYKTSNLGNVDYDKLCWLVENYHDLPDAFLWSKSNLFKYISKEEFDFAKGNGVFTPLLTQHHKTYDDPRGVPVCFYRDGMYHEHSAVVSSYHNLFPWKYAKTWDEWCKLFHIKQSTYIPFPPGGSFLLTKERVHRYGRDFYEDMLSTLPYAQTPLEAQFCERSYYLLWK